MRRYFWYDSNFLTSPAPLDNRQTHIFNFTLLSPYPNTNTIVKSVGVVVATRRQHPDLRPALLRLPPTLTFPGAFPRHHHRPGSSYTPLRPCYRRRRSLVGCRYDG